MAPITPNISVGSKPHFQEKSLSHNGLMRPLWLSDFSWKWGLEPTLMFGVIGAIFGCILLFVSILENASSQIQTDQKAKVLPLQKGQKNDNQNRYKREGYPSLLYLF